MLLFVVSLFWLAAVSAVSPLLRVVGLPDWGNARGSPRPPFGRLRLFRPSLPSGRPPLTIQAYSIAFASSRTFPCQS